MTRKSEGIILIIFLMFSLTSIAFAQEGSSEHLARAIDELIKVFDSDGWVSWKIPNTSRDALIAIGPPAIPSLFSAMDHQNPRVREWCSATLEGIVAKYSQDTVTGVDIPEDIMIEAMREGTYGENARRLAITLAVRFNGADALQPISELLSHEDLKVDAVEALGILGDSSAVPLIAEVYETGDVHFRESALRALGSIGDASAIPTLAEAAADGDASIRRIAVSILGTIGTSAEIPLLREATQDEEPDVRDAAMYSLFRMAGRLAAGDERDKGIGLYRTIFDSVDDYPVASIVAGRLKDLDVEVDLKGKFSFIDTWMVIGPFENKDNKGFDTVYPPEEEVDFTKTYQSMGQEVRWQEAKTDDVVVDLTKIFNPNTNVVAYAITSLTTPEDMDVQIKAGSDDALTIWLNGEKIHANNIGRAVTPDEDVVAAHLKEGENTILLKICQGTGSWGYCLRIVDEIGKPVTGD